MKKTEKQKAKRFIRVLASKCKKGDYYLACVNLSILYLIFVHVKGIGRQRYYIV